MALRRTEGIKIRTRWGDRFSTPESVKLKPEDGAEGLAMKRVLLCASVGVLGFTLFALLYKLVEPFLPLLPSLLARAWAILAADWFLAGLLGAAVFVIAIIAWAHREPW